MKTKSKRITLTRHAEDYLGDIIQGGYLPGKSDREVIEEALRITYFYLLKQRQDDDALAQRILEMYGG